MEKYITNIKSPKISIAPMVDRTHRHFRYFSRIMNSDMLLYTEMATAQSIINGDRERILKLRPEEGKVALQIAASNSEEAYKAVKLAEDFNYAEINLNCGCPSDRVSGNFMGAALMSKKELVYEILVAMREATDKPITIKHRIGYDGNGVLDGYSDKLVMEGYEDLLDFIETVEKAKIDRYTIHARSAILKGLSPKENREIPKLDYSMVYKLKENRPDMQIEINGGFKTIDDIKLALDKVDAVMIGRAAYENCYLLANLGVLDGNEKIVSRREILEAYEPYVIDELEKGSNIHSLITPIQSLYAGQRGSRVFKQLVSSSNIAKKNPKDLFNELFQIIN